MIDGTRQTKATIRWGLAGGGKGSMIGYAHRSAATRDRHFDLRAAVLGTEPGRGRAFGAELGLDPERCYPDHEAMFAAEAARPDGIRAVTVATPNDSHYPICHAALTAGLHVICEKPLTVRSDEAEALQALAARRGLIVGVAYGYAGYQTIREAARIVASGRLGDIRIVQLQFAHGFQSGPAEASNPSTRWRVDPATAGPSFVLGDLSTHPLYLSRVICPQLRIRRLLCTRQSFVAARAPLEDNAMTLIEYQGGAVGSCWTSAVNAGAMHGQKVRVVGALGSVAWWDERPNQLRLEMQGQPAQVLERGMPYLDAESLAEDRIAPGHPEGLFDAWSNLYARFARAIEAAEAGDMAAAGAVDYPDIVAGLEGVRWVEACVASADAGGVWIDDPLGPRGGEG